MASISTNTGRWKALDFGPPPPEGEEPDNPVLLEYAAGDSIALITLNRPQADNAITTEMGASLTEVLETIAVRPGGKDAAAPLPFDPAAIVGARIFIASRHRSSAYKVRTARLVPEGLELGCAQPHAIVQSRTQHAPIRTSPVYTRAGATTSPA